MTRILRYIFHNKLYIIAHLHMYTCCEYPIACACNILNIFLYPLINYYKFNSQSRRQSDYFYFSIFLLLFLRKRL